MAERGSTLPCSIFGGRSPKTGQPVGSRHRWHNNYCEFCGRHRDQVRRAGSEQNAKEKDRG